MTRQIKKKIKSRNKRYKQLKDRPDYDRKEKYLKLRNGVTNSIRRGKREFASVI